MKSPKTMAFVTLSAVIAISGGIWWTGSNNADAATAADKLPKPVGFEQKAYNLNPPPVLQGNQSQKEQLSSKKDKILNKVKLEKNDKITSTEFKTWKEYVSGDGSNMKNYEVDDNRLVLVVKTDCPDGVQTRGGFFRNATRTFVIDAETENLIEMRVHGDADPSTGPFNNPINSVDKE